MRGLSTLNGYITPSKTAVRKSVVMPLQGGRGHPCKHLCNGSRLKYNGRARLLPSWRRHGSAGASPSRAIRELDKVAEDMFTGAGRFQSAGRLRGVGLLAITLFFFWQCALVQSQQSNPSSELKWHVGCELFQMLLEERGMATIQSLEVSLTSPRDSVIVLTGDLRRLRSDIVVNLIPFVKRGGNVLIATDQHNLMPGIGEIKAGPVVATRVEDRYLDFKDCIRIQDIDTSHESMVGVREIVSNRTAWLSLPINSAGVNYFRWQVIASLPSDCLPSISSNHPLIAVGTGSSQVAGVMVLIADTSILTNGMIWHGDNATFAIRLSELLGRGKKTGLCFVVDGRVLSSYQGRMRPQTPNISANRTNEQPVPRIQDLPDTDLETKLRMANHVLKSVADSNILNEAMARQPRPVDTKRYVLAVLVLFAVAGVLVLLAYLIRRIPALLRLQPTIPHRSAFEMESGLRQRNSQYGPAAFILAREFCKECSGTSGEKGWRNQATGFHHSGAIPNDKAFREKLEYVRSFEISNLVPRVSEKEFLKLGKTIHELRQALQSPKIDSAT